MEDLQNLRVDVDGAIGVVTLNRPPVNAVTQPMYDELQRVFSLRTRIFPGRELSSLPEPESTSAAAMISKSFRP